MAIHLTTLGGLHAFRDGVELERLVGKRLRAALLVYLAVERRAARESLMTVFWPESNSDNARHALRQCLYQLRTELGADWLEVRPREVRGSADLQTDVHDFTSALERGQAEGAARLYRGPFLEGANLIDLQPWESWVESRRTQYARAFRKACRDWLDSRTAAGDLEGAIRAAQHWIVPDPLDDEAQHRLIGALAEAGERTAAIRQYETYERLLKAEELRALPETIALIERVRVEAAVGPALVKAALPDDEQNGTQRSDADLRSPARLSAEPAQRVRVPSRRLAFAVAAAAALLVLVIVWGANLRKAEPPIATPTDIVVLPFSVRSGGEAAYLGDGMVNLLGTALDGAFVRPADARAVFAIVAKDDDKQSGLERGSRIAARLGARLFVLGDIVEAGKLLRIEAAVFNTRGTAQPVSRVAVSGSAEHVFELVDSLAAQLLAGLGAPLGDRLTRTAAVTTSSLAAFKAYLLGESEVRAGRFERAEESYRRAIAFDSTFAIAHYRLALALDWAARGDSEAAARAAARHSERLTPRDRALVEALLAYSIGDARESERRYRAIVSRYPDDLDAWFQLAEVLFHFGTVSGRPSRESEDAWRRVLSYEPGNLSATVHLARIAAAGGRPAALDSLLAPFDTADLMMDRRLLQVATFRAIARRDTTAVNRFVQSARGWEDAAAWQLAAYLAAFSDVPSVAAQAVQHLIEPQRPPGMIADLQWFTALLDLESGRLAAARRALAEANTASAAAPRHSRSAVFELARDWWLPTLPLPYADSTLARIRHTASASAAPHWSSKASEEPGAGAEPIWFALMRQALAGPYRMEALRAYTIGTISLRLWDVAAANAASASLLRLARSDETDWFVRALDSELRARRALHDGKPEQGLRILDELEPGPVSVGATIIAPFLAQAQLRYLRGELLAAAGRDAEALSWFASLGEISVPESAFRAPAQLRLAEIQQRLGNSTEAARHYSRFIELWRDCDPELRPIVDAARARLTALARRQAQ